MHGVQMRFFHRPLPKREKCTQKTQKTPNFVFRACARKLIRHAWKLIHFQLHSNEHKSGGLPLCHRAPVGQGPSGPGWLAIALGFWSGRALATLARRGRVYV